MKTKADCLVPKCRVCGGNNVETTAWIEFREDGSERIANSESPASDDWCHDCEADVDLDYPDLTPGQLKQREQNNAARERGTELLDALQHMLCLAGSHFLLKGKRASRFDMDKFQAARELVDAIVNMKGERQ